MFNWLGYRRALAAGVATVAVLIPAGAASARTLYVTNAFTDNISTFTIGATGVPVLDARVETGDEPRGIVLTPDGRRAYVVNSGVNRVSVYRVGANGALSPLSYADTGRFPFGLALAPSGRALYVVNSDDSTVSAFAVRDDGTLERIGYPFPSGASDPGGVAVSPDGRFLYVAGLDPLDPGAVARLAIRGDGTLGPPARFGVPCEPAAIEITPDGRFLYVTCPGGGKVAGFGVGPDGGLTPVPGSTVPADPGPVGLAVTPDARHLYVTNGEFDSKPAGVRHFTIGPDGRLQGGDRTDAGLNPQSLTPTPDGRRLFVANRGLFGEPGDPNGGTVSAFDVDSAGALRKLGDVDTGGDDPLLESIAVLPNQGPRASFSAIVAGRAVRFDGSASSDSDGRVARYDWDFGDGSTQPDGGPTPTHTYPSAGTFHVKLTVTDDEGCATRRVFTGQSALCNGSAAAELTNTVRVRP